MGVALAVMVFLGVGVAFMAGMLAFSWLIRPVKERERATQAVECGEPAAGDARAIGFNYLHFAALFLVFDLAALFIFLFATIESVPPGVTIGFSIGLGTLGLMILYGTRKRRYHVA